MSYAKQNIKIVVSASPGGSIDMVARSLQTQLSDASNNFIIEYKLGAGGIVAANYVADNKNEPMILVSSIGFITNMDVPQVKYDLFNDFIYVRCAIVEPIFILVNSDSEIKTYKQFLNKSNTDIMPYSTIGNGSAGEIIARHFFKNKNFFSVPFKGGPEAINALLTNNVIWTIESISASKSLIDAKKLLPIAINTDKRNVDYPDVPTFKELGLDDKGFKRMQIVALNKGFDENTKNYLISKINNLNFSDDNKTTTCSYNKNFIEEQIKIYRSIK